MNRFARVSVFAALTFLVGSSNAAAESGRTLLATGDVIPGLGVVSDNTAFTVSALADDGRLLVSGKLDDGRVGLFWVAQDGVEPIWTSDTVLIDPENLTSIVVAPNGTSLLAQLSPHSALGFKLQVIGPNELLRTFDAPAVDAAGNAVCWLSTHGMLVNRNGDFAVKANMVGSGDSCYANAGAAVETVVYIVRSTDIILPPPLHLVPGQTPIHLVALRDDGTLVAARGGTVAGSAIDDVVVAGEPTLRTLIRSGDPGPDGSPLVALDVPLVTDDDLLAFVASSNGSRSVFRAREGRVEFAAPFGRGELVALNSLGDFVLHSRVRSDAPELTIFRADGRSETIITGGRNTGLGRFVNISDAVGVSRVGLNESGAVGFTARVFEGASGLVAFVYDDGLLEARLDSGATLADGAKFADGGLSADSLRFCLAPDGRLATLATSSTGHSGLVCVDSDGVHLIARAADATPDGSLFHEFSRCAFTENGLTFWADRRGASNDFSSITSGAVYRASDAGIERLVGDGDPVANGHTFAGTSDTRSFSVNAAGHVLITGEAGGRGLFLRRDDRELSIVRFPASNAAVLSDADGVYSLHVSKQGAWPISPVRRRLVEIRDGRLVDIFVAEAEGSYSGFADLRVRGERLYLSAYEGDILVRPSRTLTYSIGDGVVEEIPIEPQSLIDVSSDGRLLVSTEAGFAIARRDGSIENLLGIAPSVKPLSLSDAGHVLAHSATGANGHRERFLLVGDNTEIGGRCPRPDQRLIPIPSEPNPSPVPTPIVGGTATTREYVISAANDTLSAFDAETHERLATISISHRPLALTATSDGERIFVLTEGNVDIIDARTLYILARIPLGDHAEQIFVDTDSRSALVPVHTSTLGYGRLVRIDGDRLSASTLIVDRGAKAFGFAAGGHLLAVRTDGAPCDSAGQLLEIDPATGITLRATAIGTNLRGAAAIGVHGTRAYLHDGCEGLIHVVDTASLTVVGTLALDGFSFPPANRVRAAAPRPGDPAGTEPFRAVVLRGGQVRGPIGSHFALPIGIDSNGHAAHRIEFELVTGWSLPIPRRAARSADCELAPGIAATAVFLFTDPFCGSACDRIHVRIEMTDPDAVLPDAEALFHCWPSSAHGALGARPVVLQDATANDTAGNPLPVVVADGLFEVVRAIEATPGPTRPPLPTLTPTPTQTPSPMPLEALVMIDDARVSVGDSATLVVSMVTAGNGIAGAQLDLSLPDGVSVVVNGFGEPDCRAAEESGKTFHGAFLEESCVSDEPCGHIRAVMLSFSDLEPIPDGELFTCTIQVADDAIPGTYPINLDELTLGSPAGTRIRAQTFNGELTVEAGSQTSTATATAAVPSATETRAVPIVPSATPSVTATALPDVADPSDGRIEPDVGDPGTAAAATSAGGDVATASGCHAAGTRGGGGAWLLLGFALLVLATNRAGSGHVTRATRRG